MNDINFNTNQFKIVELNDIRNAKKYITKDTTVLCDLDNTLITSKNLISTSMFWDFIVDKSMNSLHLPKHEAVKKITKLSNLLNNNAQSIPVDQAAPGFLSELESRGLTVMGFSARRPINAPETIKQVENAGYHFKGLKSAPFSISIIENQPEAIYDQAICFTGNQHTKGEILEKLISKINFKAIVMFDDLEANLIEMKKSCEKMNIPFVGIRYSKMDSLVKNFPVEKALQELKEFFSHHKELEEEYQYLLN